MREVDALLCANENFCFVSVVLQTVKTPTGWSQPYFFKTLLDLKTDDLVVVPVCQQEQTQMKVAKVVATYEPFSPEVNMETEHKWVMSIVDLSVYEDCIAAECSMRAQLSMAKAHKLQKESMALLEENVGKSVMTKLKNLVGKL